ncbi:hypothetical protein [Pseudomonas aeruginosa]|uniref:hypothetical protein n=1 Tax=Pseudomonas aeruginosa TaxID=287 RepID=UPI0029C01986|nr:hypothetical protein [Pseudomonas aeruginosa]
MRPQQKTVLGNHPTSLPPPSDDELADMKASGYFLDTKRFPCGRVAGVIKFMFTYAIVADVTVTSYSRRWCYSDLMATLCALEDWDDYETRPEGWHRETHSGERRSADGKVEFY